MCGEAHNALGAAYGKMEQWDDTVAEYQKALNNPQYATPQGARYNLWDSVLQKEDYQSALSEFRGCN